MSNNSLISTTDISKSNIKIVDYLKDDLNIYLILNSDLSDVVILFYFIKELESIIQSKNIRNCNIYWIHDECVDKFDYKNEIFLDRSFYELSKLNNEINNLNDNNLFIELTFKIKFDNDVIDRNNNIIYKDIISIKQSYIQWINEVLFGLSDIHNILNTTIFNYNKSVETDIVGVNNIDYRIYDNNFHWRFPDTVMYKIFGLINVRGFYGYEFLQSYKLVKYHNPYFNKYLYKYIRIVTEEMNSEMHCRGFGSCRDPNNNYFIYNKDLINLISRCCCFIGGVSGVSLLALSILGIDKCLFMDNTKNLNMYVNLDRINYLDINKKINYDIIDDFLQNNK